jgi:CelD/BcsL family acetyltransferase involved in cellulose biosynthesis
MTSTSHPLAWIEAPAAAPAPPLVVDEAARVEIFPSLAEACRDWVDLQAAACASPYQSFAFAEAWFATIGAASGIEPFIIVARDASGQPSALLPLAQRRFGPLALATFPGGRDSNFNLGLFRPGRLWGAVNVRSLLMQAARAAPVRIDCFALLNQPRIWQGFRNPMATLGGRPSPSFAYKSELPRSFSEWRDAHVSKGSRKKLRKMAERLASMGPVSHVIACDATQASQVLGALIAQKRQAATDGGPPNPYDSAGFRSLQGRK